MCTSLCVLQINLIQVLHCSPDWYVIGQGEVPRHVLDVVQHFDRILTKKAASTRPSWKGVIPTCQRVCSTCW
jgi:hypothetical protein